MAVTSIQIEINPYIGAITVNGNIYFYKKLCGADKGLRRKIMDGDRYQSYFYLLRL